MNYRAVAGTLAAAVVSGAFTFGVAYALGEEDRRTAEEFRCRARESSIADARQSELLAEIGDLIESSFVGEPTAQDQRELHDANVALRQANIDRERSIAACEQGD